MPAIFAVISLIVGLGSLFFFGWSSRRSFSPLIRLGWLRDPMVLLHLIAYMLLPIVGIGFGYVITNLAQLSLGTNAFLAGALVLPGALIGAFFAPIGGTLYDRFGPVRPILGAFFLAICGPILLLVFSMRLTPATLAGFYFIFGLGYALGFSNIMTNALRSIAPQFMPDGNAVFNTCLQFGGAAGTALFSTVLSVAQAGAGKEGTEAFSHATAVGGSWTFTVMIVIVAVAICCLITAFRIGAKRKCFRRRLLHCGRNFVPRRFEAVGCETIENTGKGDKVSNLSAPLPVMAGEDMPAGPTDPIFNRLLKDRIIWMGEEVKDEMANRICAQMLMLAAEDPKKDIWLYINSPGGSITAGMAIYDTMQLIEPDVATVGLGMCASMGQFLLSSGTKGKRFLTSHARVLMHQPSGGIGGTATDVRINAELIMDMKKTMSELTAEQTGHTVEEIYRDNEYDHWFTAQEALEYGFVDKLVSTHDTMSATKGE